MDLLNVAPQGNEYASIDEHSTDEEKLSAVLAVLANKSTPININYKKLCVSYEKEKLFNAKLKSTGLVETVDDDNSYNPGFKLNDPGHLMLENYTSYLDYTKEKNEADAKKEQEDKNIESLKLENIVLAVNKLRAELADYGDTKRRLKRSEGYAILALIVSAILLVLKAISNKYS